MRVKLDIKKAKSLGYELNKEGFYKKGSNSAWKDDFKNKKLECHNLDKDNQVLISDEDSEDWAPLELLDKKSQEKVINHFGKWEPVSCKEGELLVNSRTNELATESGVVSMKEIRELIKTGILK